ncbi:alpha/beta hydrolase [Natronospira bacteriovora]|uniref:Alpha/beta hydrolase n=1 Tax=Natronospira bacteriovora TaxID=3069753 RepID=A0ABU0W9F8_9GAMM|nr:alpha/beta fold hydrolase [Natronospira sp. AB-CW4]MDQ2070626.1 alpha/beta hydrolase [Natronospira sp. AB-CW4]
MMATGSGNSERIMIEGPAGQLEGILEHPADPPVAIAVACHPHPQHEGTMHNKVVHTLARAFRDAGAVTLRFNFRGVGRSEGEFDRAIGETEDALAAIAFLRARYPGLPLWLGGFSFGAQVSIQASSKANPDCLISIAPPVQRFGEAKPARPDCPWLVVQGEADEVVEADGVFRWINSHDPAPTVKRFPGVGHFFHGKLTPLHRTIREFLADQA